jgi:DNA ligase-1
MLQLPDGFKPQLLYRFNPPLEQLPYPVLMSAKVDGVRTFLSDEGPKSRTMKLAPNAYVRRHASHSLLEGFDCELHVGESNAPNVFERSNQMWKTHLLEQPFGLLVFDDATHLNDRYWDRYRRARERINLLEQSREHLSVRLLEHFWVNSPEELLQEEERILANGYEGAIIRCPNAPYKPNRTTLRDMNAFKLKRFLDSTARVVGFEEATTNTNEAYIAENGAQKRSTHAAGLIPAGRLGSFIMEDTMPNNSEHRFFGVRFNCGSGFDHEFAVYVWNHKEEFLDKEFDYKYFPPGSKDAPRHPIWRPIRDSTDTVKHE